MEMHGVLNMKALIAFLLLTAPALAQENSVSIVVTSPTKGAITQQWILTTDEYAKFSAWLQSAYPCTPVAPATTCLPDLAASVQAWETATIQGTVDNVNRAGAQKLAADAVAGGTPITPNLATKTEKAKK